MSHCLLLCGGCMGLNLRNCNNNSSIRSVLLSFRRVTSLSISLTRWRREPLTLVGSTQRQSKCANRKINKIAELVSQPTLTVRCKWSLFCTPILDHNRKISHLIVKEYLWYQLFVDWLPVRLNLVCVYSNKHVQVYLLKIRDCLNNQLLCFCKYSCDPFLNNSVGTWRMICWVGFGQFGLYQKWHWPWKNTQRNLALLKQILSLPNSTNCRPSVQSAREWLHAWPKIF